MKTYKQKVIEFLDKVPVDILSDEEFMTLGGKLEILLKEQDRDTRHACAEAVTELPVTNMGDVRYNFEEEGVSLTDVHNTIMNCNKGG